MSAAEDFLDLTPSQRKAIRIARANPMQNPHESFELREALLFVISQEETKISREIMWLTYWGGYSDQEIAKELDLHPDMVKLSRETTLKNIRRRKLLLAPAGFDRQTCTS